MLWVVGEQMARGVAGEGGGSVERLARLAGVTGEQLVNRAVWLNLWDHATDPAPYVRLVEERALPGDGVLLLGRRVARAFDLADLGALEGVRRNGGDGPEIVALPHPSGLNRWWNDPAHAADARDVVGRMWRTYA